MLKIHLDKIQILFLIVFSIFLFSSIVYSSNNDFETPRNCSQIFGNCDDSTTNDSCQPSLCSGVQSGSYAYVSEVYINATSFLFGSGINVTCKYVEAIATWDYSYYGYIWYYNNSRWINILNFTNSTPYESGTFYISSTFKLNSSEGPHIVRCIFSIDTSGKKVPNECANITYNNHFDNDDVNFTVTDYFKYYSWNLINGITGETILNGVHLTKNNLINVSAYWNKNISLGLIRHNGTGSFQNYTFLSIGNWTNYTLVLYNTTYFNTTGPIEISYIWANDTFGLENYTSPSKYFYLWGNSKVGQIYLNQTSIYNDTGARIFCQVLDDDTNQPISGYNISFYMNDTYLNSSLTNSTGWANLSYTFYNPSLPANFTLKCNITDSESLYYNATQQNSNNTILTVVSPYELLLGYFYFKSGPATVSNQTNLNNTDFKFYLYVSDTLQVESVTINLTYPENAINVNLSMIPYDEHYWSYRFNNNSYPLNMTGTYTIGIIAKNSYGFQNVSTNFTTFFVNDTYTLQDMLGHPVYMRGENITVQALDVYNLQVENVNWTVNITKINKTYTESNVSTNYTYQIKLDDPEGNYTIFVNATKDGNHGNLIFDFNVSSELNLSVQTGRSSPVPRYVDITVNISVYNARLTPHTLTINGNISCYNSSFMYTTFPLTFSSNNASFTCYSSSEYSKNFNITVNVADVHNNTGIAIINLTTESQQIITQPSTGGGGGGGGGPTNVTIPPENCTDKIDNDKDNKTDCEDEDCFYHPACVGKRQIPGFNFTLSPIEIEIFQGEDGTVIGTMTNTGDLDLNLISSVDIENDCCLVSMNSTFFLPNRTTSSTFPILIHVNTSTPVGEYIINVKLTYTYLQNSQSIKVIVKENPIISSLKQMSGQIAETEKKIQEYKRVGLDIADLEGILTRIKQMLSGSQESINKDDINKLKSDESSIKSSLSDINNRLNELAFVKAIYENKWNITGGIIISIISVYLITQVIYPFAKLTAEITKLKFEEATQVESRKATEKQYFLRKIDEDTFRRIVSEKHSQVLKLQSTIALKKQQRTDLLRKRLNPLELGRYIKQKLSKKRTEQKTII